MQVLKVVSPNLNGMSQLSHPDGMSNSAQIARNPDLNEFEPDLNVTVTEFVFVRTKRLLLCVCEKQQLLYIGDLL